MSDFVKNALLWAQEQREEHAGSEICIGLNRASAKPILATVVSSKSEVSQNAVTVQMQIFKFVVKKDDLRKHNIRLQRGLSIWYKTGRFELIYSKNTNEYNDPDMLDIVLKAVMKADSDGTEPSYPISG